MPYKDAARRRTYAREWVARRRAEWFAGKVCMVCGSTDRLELDHIDPTQKISHSVWSWTKERRDTELAKCQVLCFEHHKAKTVEHIATREHDPTMYRNGCRCAVCRESQRLRNAAWRAGRRSG